VVMHRDPYLRKTGYHEALLDVNLDLEPQWAAESEFTVDGGYYAAKKMLENPRARRQQSSVVLTTWPLVPFRLPGLWDFGFHGTLVSSALIATRLSSPRGLL